MKRVIIRDFGPVKECDVLLENVNVMGMKMEDFDLPSDLDELINITKDKVSSQKDPRLLKLCKMIQISPEISRFEDIQFLCRGYQKPGA